MQEVEYYYTIQDNQTPS